MADFSTSFIRLQKWEGGFVLENVSGDSGGKTCSGISYANNPAWPGWNLLAKNGNVIDDGVKQAVIDFYELQYNGIGMDKIIAQPVADQIFQGYINCGGIALAWAQAIAGVAQDRIIGAESIAAINSVVASSFCGKYANAQDAYYDAIVARNPSQEKFLAGWKARSADFRNA
jgi:lysozyme family protein